MSRSLKSLSDASKDAWWRRVDLPRSCFDVCDSSFFGPDEMWDFKQEISEWLDSEIGRNCYEIKRGPVYDAEGYESGNRVTAVLFKKDEDAILFATTWF